MPLDNSDLIGGDQGTPNTNTGISGAVEQGISDANQRPDKAVREKEEALVKQTWKEYQDARDFDKPQRTRMAKDRRYAAGNADPRWASDANLIGSFIDILVSFLYA